MSMLPQNPIIGACGICGRLSDPKLLPVLGDGLVTCKHCHKKVCKKCYSQSRELCVVCVSGKGSWCRTPGKP